MRYKIVIVFFFCFINNPFFIYSQSVELPKIIRIFDIQQNEGHIGVDYTEEYIQLEIIDNENIVLTFLNNAPPAFVNDNKTVELRRSPDLWWPHIKMGHFA